MQTTALLDVCDWIDASALSQLIQTTPWVVPTLQTVHILAIAVVLASGLMLALRTARLSGADQPLAQAIRRAASSLWPALAVLLMSGSLLAIGEPARSLANDYFQIKMLLLVVACILFVLLQGSVRRRAALQTGGDAGRRELTLAWLGLACWVGIAIAGRWIAYL